jgi:hypothetical protein
MEGLGTQGTLTIRQKITPNQIINFDHKKNPSQTRTPICDCPLPIFFALSAYSAVIRSSNDVST